MSLIQFGLLVSAFAALISYFRFFRSVLLDRMLALAFFIVMVTAIIFPQITVKIANIVGVGRGTDLVFYVYLMGSIFVFILLYSKILTTESKLTEIIRALALENVRKPNQ